MFSSLTNEEYFRLHGTLPPERIEELLDNVAEVAAVDVAGAVAHMDEARGQFMPEDFCHDIIDKMVQLKSSLRGNNRETLQHIIEMLEDAIQLQFYASDYGLGELHEAKKCLGKL